MTDTTGAATEDTIQHTIGDNINAKDWTSNKVDAYLEIVLDNVQQIRQVYSDTLTRGQSLLGFEGVILALTGAAVTEMTKSLCGNVPALLLLFTSVALIKFEEDDENGHGTRGVCEEESKGDSCQTHERQSSQTQD